MGNSQHLGIEDSENISFGGYTRDIKKWGHYSPGNSKFAEFIRPVETSNTYGTYSFQHFYVGDVSYLALGLGDGIAIVDMESDKLVHKKATNWAIFNLEVIYVDGMMFVMGENNYILFSIHLDGENWTYTEYKEASQSETKYRVCMQSIRHFLVYIKRLRRIGDDGEGNLHSIFNVKHRKSCAGVGQRDAVDVYSSPETIHICSRERFFVTSTKGVVDLYSVDSISEENLTLKKLCRTNTKDRSISGTVGVRHISTFHDNDVLHLVLTLVEKPNAKIEILYYDAKKNCIVCTRNFKISNRSTQSSLLYKNNICFSYAPDFTSLLQPFQLKKILLKK